MTKIHQTQDPKYGIKNNRIVNMKTGDAIPEDEPIFILRAKDINASLAIVKYSELCKDKCHQEAVLDRWSEFIEFNGSHPHRMGQPDT